MSTTKEDIRAERATVSLESIADSLEKLVELLAAWLRKGKGR